MATATESKKFLNIGVGNTAAFALKGGKYTALVNATFGGGNVQLQTLAGDGSTFVNVGAAITAAGLTNYDLPPGQFRFAVTTATAVFISLTSVPP
jgi:hypothetical protein